MSVSCLPDAKPNRTVEIAGVALHNEVDIRGDCSLGWRSEVVERNYADFYGPNLWQRAKGWLKRRWKIVCGALGALLVGYAGAVLNEIAPAPESARSLACRAGEWWSEPAPGKLFTILISNLGGDTDGQQTKLVRDVFLGQRGLDVRRTCHVVALDGSGGSITEEEAQATKQGHALLDDWNADLLIWGEVRQENSELSLWFLSRERGSTLGRPPYSVSENLTLPVDFREDLAAQLEAVAFAQIVPSTSADADRISELLKPPAEKLRRLLSARSDVLPRPRTPLIYSFGDASAAIGIQTEDLEWLEQAIAAYHEVLSQWTRERVPLGWAAAQQSLGLALHSLGQINGDSTASEDAVEALCRSLEEWTEAKVLRRIVMAADNLDGVLQDLWLRALPPALLERVAAAYHKALVVLPRDSALHDWAWVQNYLGVTLTVLGERQGGTEFLEEAVAAHHAALEQIPRERVPLDFPRLGGKPSSSRRSASARRRKCSYSRSRIMDPRQ